MRRPVRRVSALLLALACVAVPASAAAARPTPNQFAALMEKALIAKAKTYHVTKASIVSAFKRPELRQNLYSAGAIICQKLATESPKQAAAELVAFTNNLPSLAQGGAAPSPSPTPQYNMKVLRGVVGVGLTVTTAKGSLCGNQRTKAMATLKIYNKTVGAK